MGTRITVVLPIPFNHIAAASRVLYYWLRYRPYGKFDKHVSDILQERFSEGFQYGYEVGYRAGMKDLQKNPKEKQQPVEKEK